MHANPKSKKASNVVVFIFLQNFRISNKVCSEDLIFENLLFPLTFIHILAVHSFHWENVSMVCYVLVTY